MLTKFYPSLVPNLLLLLASINLAFPPEVPGNNNVSLDRSRPQRLRDRVNAAEKVFLGKLINRVEDGDWVKAELLVELPMKNAEKGANVAVIWRKKLGNKTIYDAVEGTRGIAVLKDRHEDRYWLREDKYEKPAMFAEVENILSGADGGKRKAANGRAKKIGKWTITPNPDLPNVLILGDSISIDYTWKVRRILRGKANVFRPHSADGSQAENCEGTTKSLGKIDQWLDGHKWDVIHFNWGLHDMKRVKQQGSAENSTNPQDPYQATVEQYSSNLELLVGKLNATGAKLIFATTTPVVAGSEGAYRDAKDPSRYNEAALKIMEAQKIQVNDLYALCNNRLDELQNPKDVHFNKAGIAIQSKHVVKAIKTALPK